MMMQMQDLAVRHRVRPTTKHTGVTTRSTSLSKRPTSEMFTFQELEVKESTRPSQMDVR